MNDLRILIARLGWPATSARWWTIQELAARLGEPDTKAETESLLLQLLRSRKLEAEVVEPLASWKLLPAVRLFDKWPSNGQKTGRHIQMHRTKGMQDISFGPWERALPLIFPLEQPFA